MTHLFQGEKNSGFRSSSLSLLRHSCFLLSLVLLPQFCFLLHVLTHQRLVPAHSLSQTNKLWIRSEQKELSQHCKPFPQDKKQGRGQSTQIKCGHPLPLTCLPIIIITTQPTTVAAIIKQQIFTLILFLAASIVSNLRKMSYTLPTLTRLAFFCVSLHILDLHNSHGP